LRTAHETRPEDEGVAETAELLYGMALLAEGGELTDPSRFIKLMAQRLQHSL
jgi:molecular chaperone HtpG